MAKQHELSKADIDKITIVPNRINKEKIEKNGEMVNAEVYYPAYVEMRATITNDDGSVKTKKVVLEKFGEPQETKHSDKFVYNLLNNLDPRLGKMAKDMYLEYLNKDVTQ